MLDICASSDIFSFWDKTEYMCNCFMLVIWSAPPKVFNLKIVGEAREGSKVSASATVTGGTEGSSRVQWYKASSSEFKNEHELQALSTSKVSKVRSALFSTAIIDALLKNLVTFVCFIMFNVIELTATFFRFYIRHSEFLSVLLDIILL